MSQNEHCEHSDSISTQSQKLLSNLSGSNSHLHNIQASSQQQHVQPLIQSINTQSPNTPTSIPEIIFTGIILYYNTLLYLHSY